MFYFDHGVQRDARWLWIAFQGALCDGGKRGLESADYRLVAPVAQGVTEGSWLDALKGVRLIVASIS